MTTAAAFKATYSDWKLVKSRKVVQIVLEVPMESADAAYQLLGGMPNPAAETWVAVARINPEEAPKPAQKEKRRWETLSVGEQAGIRCGESDFQRWLGVNNADEAATELRRLFNVSSRRDIRAPAWEQHEHEYQLWLRASL